MIATVAKSPQAIPLLENGDNLTRCEFERRYNAMPNLKKAELIEGIVHLMASPLRITNHGNPHARIITWLGNYWSSTPGIELGDNCTVRLDTDNEPQPDALLRIKNGGQSTISEDGYVEGAPELIVEIFPGLWLDRDALLAGDLAKVLEVLQLGIATLKHQSS